MKAIVLDEYGSPDVLELREIDKPVVGDDEVLVRVHADCLHPDVRHMMRGMPYFLRIIGAGLRMPSNRVPGTDLAGSVEAVGRNVTQFRPGDDVFGENVSGHQWHNGGAFAEYVSAPEDTLALKPARLMFDQAAAVPTSGFIALQGVRDQGHVQPEQKVLINGAGGGVGTFAVQLAKSCGADVTGVDRTEKLDMIRSIGAGHVIDYTQEDFTRARRTLRPHCRRSGEPFVGRSPARPHPRGDLHPHRARRSRSFGRSLDRERPESGPQTARVLAVREPANGSARLFGNQTTPWLS